ncbi:penicillin-binding protein activator [Gluconobacter sphaericus]|uniref:Penicillin-binding protein activator n=1 Tax=Gluconobacter sphaericus NBRC 12467 TaxID=1307951 RepID=A0AA37SGB2_9PROT|nr:penicillin-binding protein activator [Gluconobacter sphaericus]MBF0884325.1 penicillin-binding protein activator [Gluconobacter sphaericus]GBR52894.1 amino acid ABC transporter substrate-binding protein [Gluconobacter sphaericus NBRC 12467]GEB42476.1 penicillin-binding protein activator [Gluconobacter sphaericus NBRC 12467]GLQ83778.1 penicillin-binding protein activator [Gluconobacter sphaericus NBRC 12467]
MSRLRKGVSTGLAAGTFLTLAACSGGGSSSVPGVGGVPGVSEGPGAHDVGLILPLTGRNAAYGLRMRDAAKLALSAKGSPALDVHDTNAPGGTEQAVRDALARGDAILLGPLTATETAAAAPLAINAGKPELAFTSDSRQARPGIWVMGLTPEQQVRRMVDAARATGRKTFAAFLPDNAFGHAMGDGLARACRDAGLKDPQIVFHTMDAQNIDDGLKTLSAIETRQPAAPALAPTDVPAGPSAIDPTGETTANPTGSTETGATSATPPAPQGVLPVPPPPFDALVLADTGLELGRVITALQADHIDSSQVQIMGPALWKAFDGKLGALHGAWYAASDAHDRMGYVAQYRALYKQSPSPVTDFAYDAAALAGSLIRQGGVTTQALTRPDGYMGVDGLFRLRPDGHVTRALAIYQIQRGGGARIVVPASRDVAIRPS